MYTVIQMSGRYYAKKHSVNSERQINEFMEYVESFTNEGTAVTLVEDLFDAAELFEIDLADIEVVED
jgi:hypothetical protein